MSRDLKPRRNTAAASRKKSGGGTLIGLFIGLSFLSPYFLTWGNIRAVILSFSTEGMPGM